MGCWGTSVAANRELLHQRLWLERLVWLVELWFMIHYGHCQYVGYRSYSRFLYLRTEESCDNVISCLLLVIFQAACEFSSGIFYIALKTVNISKVLLFYMQGNFCRKAVLESFRFLENNSLCYMENL